MKKMWWIIVAALLVLLGALFVFKYTQSSQKQEVGACPFFNSISGVTFDDFARSSPYYVRYYASDNVTKYPAYTSMDGHKVTLTRIGHSEDYNFTMTSVNNKQVVSETKTVYSVDENSKKVKKYGVWQDFHIISFKNQSYALIYFCIPPNDGVHEVYRAIMSVSLDNDLAEPLAEDKDYNFTQGLYELPYKYREFYS
uniref:Lipocalin/cytosolic fatty-acid binding domain-containing protein n=1 Tax=Clastoptera arizonana TaxID=38151 RepID=A0A1B6CZU5_9HEMI